MDDNEEFSRKIEPLWPWFKMISSYVRSDFPDLTNRQMALLLLTYLDPGPHTVRGISARLQISKPVVTRILNALTTLGYVRRKKDAADLRSIFVERTSVGRSFLEAFAGLVTGPESDDRQPTSRA